MVTIPEPSDTRSNHGQPSARDLARWALRDHGSKLSDHAKLVWLMLDTRGLDPHPSIATLAANCSTGTATVKRALNELEASGWLRRTHRRTEAGDADTNHYDLICPVETPFRGGLTVSPPLAQSEPTVGSERSTKYQQEDQQEDQQTKTRVARREAPGMREGQDQDQDQDQKTQRREDPQGWTARRMVAAYLARSMLGAEPDGQAAGYLARTVLSDPGASLESFTRAAWRAFSAAPGEWSELAYLAAEGFGHVMDDDAEPLLTQARAGTRTAAVLTEDEVRWCDTLAGRVHAAAQYELALDPDGCPVAATLQEAAEAGAEMADDDERNRS
jgi:hypothetical protein